MGKELRASAQDMIGSGAIDADAIASDAVTAAKVAADVSVENANAVWAKTMSDLTSVPGATAAVLDALNFMFMLARNKFTQTAGTSTLFKDDGSTTVGTSAVSDDTTTLTRGEWT